MNQATGCTNYCSFFCAEERSPSDPVALCGELCGGRNKVKSPKETRWQGKILKSTETSSTAWATQLHQWSLTVIKSTFSTKARPTSFCESILDFLKRFESSCWGLGFLKAQLKSGGFVKDVSQFLCLKIGDHSGTNEFLTLPEFQTNLLFARASLSLYRDQWGCASEAGHN